jgi:endonuclease YncB( thermonuclease family)
MRSATMLRALILVLSLAAPAAAEVRVVDGDTLAIDGVRHRLFGIDAPERGEPGAAAATEHLRRLVGHDRPICERVDFDWRNARPVSLCSVRGADLSLAMVRAGWAVSWCSFLEKIRPKLLPVFRAAEAEAKVAKRGIWERPMRPWRAWGCY